MLLAPAPTHPPAGAGLYRGIRMIVGGAGVGWCRWRSRQPAEDLVEGAEGRGDEIRAGFLELRGGEAAGGDGDAAAAVDSGAADIVRRVADDRDLCRVDRFALGLAEALDGDGREMLARGRG